MLSVHSSECRVAIEEDIVSCTFRGRLRLGYSQVHAGDLVHVSQSAGAYVIDEIATRRNLLSRPPIANVDQAIVVTAITQPPLDLLYVDRILAQLEFEEIQGVICVNKQDIENEGEIGRVSRIYSSAGYKCVVTSAVTGYGLDGLAGLVRGKVTVFAGQSGAGKSKLISALMGVKLLTGQLSQGLRGRHTTRWVQLIRAPGDGYIADTPGFSRLDLVDVEPHELGFLYPEIKERAALCHFPRCLHKTESRCEVLDALSKGKIAQERYSNYLMLLEEATERAKRRYE
ncbi:MAG TPA: ribosome small subunit-dependent GTPase A [Firmicutes bacterium]|nr:ribosome small subunit-dependent GTPase A [Candidatus Fermentithermobacillaceae bacterium]